MIRIREDERLDYLEHLVELQSREIRNLLISAETSAALSQERIEELAERILELEARNAHLSTLAVAQASLSARPPSLLHSLLPRILGRIKRIPLVGGLYVRLKTTYWYLRALKDA